MHFSAWSKFFLKDLVLEMLGSGTGYPYQFNTTKIGLCRTLKMKFKQ